jgi:hypothetical protein
MNTETQLITKPPSTLHRIKSSNIVNSTIASATASLGSATASLGSATSSLGTSEPISWPVWIAIILILAILGINVFGYLAQGTQFFANIAKVFTDLFAKLFGSVSKQVIGTSAQGVGGVAQGVNALAQQTVQATQVSSSASPSAISPTDTTIQNALNSALQTQNHEQQDGVLADDALSSIQMNKSSGKSGYCYIGEERGFRSCVKVGENDTCMSGDIFPSSEICVNPSLRQ